MSRAKPANGIPAARAMLLKLPLAWLILALGAVLSVALALFARELIVQETRLHFEADSRELVKRVEAEIGAYEEVLVGLRAFVASKESLTRAEFHRYVEGLELKRRFPGFQNLNFAQYVPAAELERFEQSVRADASLQPGGYPEFRVRPAGPREEYHVITQVEPFESNRAAFGLDIAANPAAAWAHRRVVDTGEITTSGRLIRVDGPTPVVALAMRLAVYRGRLAPSDAPARASAYLGSVGAGYRVRDLVREALKVERFDGIRFRIYDRGPAQTADQTTAPGDEQLLFASNEIDGRNAAATDHGGAGDSGEFKARIALPVGGRTWEVFLAAPGGAFGILGGALPWLVLAAGIAASGLLAGLFNSYATSRRSAERIAREITRDLQESEAELAEAQHVAGLGSWTYRPADGRVIWSREAQRILGTETGRPPQTLREYIARAHPADRASLRGTLHASFRRGSDCELDHRTIRADGSERWLRCQLQFARGANGAQAVPRGTLMDITDRKVIDRRKELEVVVARLLATARPARETLDDVLLTAAEMYGWTGARLWHWRKDDQALRLLSSKGPLSAAAASRLEETILRAVQAGAGGAAPLAGGVHQEIACGLMLPILTDGQISDLLVFHSREPRLDDQTTLQAMQLVATLAGHFLHRRRAEENLQYVATHDALTGLPNRRRFNQALEESIARVRGSGHALTVLFLDLDRFKNINDTLGHGAGDAVIAMCAQRFVGALRDTDVIAHLAGDEFVVLLEHRADHKASVAVARKLLEAAANPISIQGHELAVSASIGISTFPEDGEDAETLLKNADIAMYRAKDLGRNNFQFYSAQMNGHSVERLALESSLRRALERGELSLHYQPKIDLRTRQVTGVEALLRWQHPERGMIPPVEFIPLAEETGLIVPIGAWVLKTACEQAKRWRDSGLPGVRVAVNLSPRQFRDRGLSRDIGRVIEDTGLDPRLLELEITESMVMHEPEQAAAMLKDLKAMGLQLSIDDFGTGYSSLAYLKKFPIDCIKVDRSFVKNIPQDADDLAITEAVIALAHSLRLRVVAEGVETAEQLEWLRRFGCDEMQGYFISKPLPAEEAGRFLANHFRREESGRPGRAVALTAT